LRVTYLPGEPVKTSGHVERLREEALDLARTRHGELVLGRELVHAEIAMISRSSLYRCSTDCTARVVE
jgi:hypothetical protein